MTSEFARNIRDGFSNARCSGCGICAVICPVQAISLRLTSKGINEPFVDKTRCIHCNKCRDVCPGIDLDLDDLNHNIFGTLPKNSDIGVCRAVYKGYSLNNDLRYQCSSGGVVTSTLLYLFNKKIIDSAVVTRMLYGDFPIAESFLAYTEKEVIEARGSKYCPVSLHKGLLEAKKNRVKAAVVCLPCHTIGLRKAMLCDLRLNDSIKYIFTLFCNQTPSYNALKFFFRKRQIDPFKVQDFRWRGRGWPGFTESVTTQKADAIPFTKAWHSFFGNGYFTPYACYCCSDFYGEFSDISFGDAWLPEQYTDKLGTNIIVVRSQQGQALLDEMQFNRSIKLHPLETYKINNAFALNIMMKKRGYRIHQKLIRGCPQIRQSNVKGKTDLCTFLREMYRLLKIKLGRLLFN